MCREILFLLTILFWVNAIFYIIFFSLQGIKPALEPPPIRPKSDDPETANPFAIARPHATDLMLQRQTSFREFSRLNQRTSPFKRQLSLRVSDLPSSLERKNNDASDFNNGGISNSMLEIIF